MPSRASSRLRLAPGGGLLRQHTVVLRRRFEALRSEQDQDPAEVGVQFLRFFGGRAAKPGFPPCTEDSSPEPNGNMRNEIKQKEEMRKVIFVRPFPPPQGETAASTGNATEAVPGPTQEKILLQTYPTQEASPFSEKGRQRRPRGVALHMPSGRSLVSNRPCPRGVALRVRVGKIPVLRSGRPSIGCSILMFAALWVPPGVRGAFVLCFFELFLRFGRPGGPSIRYSILRFPRMAPAPGCSVVLFFSDFGSRRGALGLRHTPTPCGGGRCVWQGTTFGALVLRPRLVGLRPFGALGAWPCVRPRGVAWCPTVCVLGA